ncbi:hypothetical protein LTR78_010654 [Recurvomyces mirabilis]|uniref:Uncharacterized protein n=1 Tax=Recurvomyces mirabilis TaxID=574656 RepID=A0AAE0TQ30_9PEZI|nr:hypothetical protein LTR78_010654 [Recurvomyces mirabilis]
MATPTFNAVEPLAAEDLVRKLELETQRQQDQTPEVEFENDCSKESHRILLEAERERYSAHEINRLRAEISDVNYWKTEVKSRLALLLVVIGDKVIQQQCREHTPTAGDMRNISDVLGRKLKRQGCTSRRMHEYRLDIEDEGYWRCEANLLRSKTSQRHHDIESEARKRVSLCSQKVASPGRGERTFAGRIRKKDQRAKPRATGRQTRQRLER